MDDTETVMALATVALALFSLAAVVVSIFGLSSSRSAGRDAAIAQRDALQARADATRAQWKMSEHLETIAESQAHVAQALAAGGMPGGAVASQRSGRLSARLSKVGRSGWRFTVANVGLDALVVRDVSLDQDAAIGLEGLSGAELEPGEDLSVPAALTMDMHLPLTATLRWEDREGAHEREQKVTPS